MSVFYERQEVLGQMQLCTRNWSGSAGCSLTVVAEPMIRVRFSVGLEALIFSRFGNLL